MSTTIVAPPPASAVAGRPAGGREWAARAGLVSPTFLVLLLVIAYPLSWTRSGASTRRTRIDPSTGSSSPAALSSG